MSIKKVPTGYEIRFRVAGRGSRSYRKTFPTKGECERFMRYTIAQHETQSGDKPWLEKPKDSRKLSELIETWDELHGHFLKDDKRRKTKMLMIADQLGDPQAKPATYFATHSRVTSL